MAKREEKKVRGIYEKEPGSDIWSIRYADGTGSIRREKVGPKSAAIQLYRKRKTEVLQGAKLPENFRKKAVTFGVLADDALEYSKAHKRSYRMDQYRMKPLRDQFGAREADKITPQDLERWLADCADENNWKPATINRSKALLSLVFRLEMENGKVGRNPARLVKRRLENNAPIRFLSHEEESRLREVIERDCPERLSELEIALNTGIRCGEQYGLTWEFVNFSTKVLTVALSKNGETRHVPMNTVTIAAFKRLGKNSEGHGSVFANQGPRHWFEAAIEAANIEDFTWHCLRHTFASRLVMKGVDIRTVQELMGHKTIQMTVRYAHLAPQHTLAAVERLCEPVKAEATQEAPTSTRTSTSDSESVLEQLSAVPQAIAAQSVTSELGL
jgi:site-specific recombinase XerD